MRPKGLSGHLPGIVGQNHAIIQYLTAKRRGLIKYDPGLARVIAATRQRIVKAPPYSEAADELNEALSAEAHGALLGANLHPGMTPTQLDDAIRTATLGMEAVVASQVRDIIKQAYQEGVKQAAQSVEAVIEFGGRHEAAISAIAESETLSTAFDALSTDAARFIKERIERAFQEAEVSPSNIAAELARELGPELRWRLERIARTETHVAFEQGKENVYREVMADRDEEFLFRYAGPQDHKTSKQCQEIHRRIREQGGATLDELNDIIAEVSQDPRFDGRAEWDPYRGRLNALSHPQCRHARVRWMNAPRGDLGVKS